MQRIAVGLCRRPVVMSGRHVTVWRKETIVRRLRG
jgi:hypothetical protein